METEYGLRLLRHRRGNPDPELCRSLTHRATSRLYPVGASEMEGGLRKIIGATRAICRASFSNTGREVLSSSCPHLQGIAINAEEAKMYT